MEEGDMHNKIIICLICILLFTVAFTLEVPKDVSAQVTEEWVARYNGPGDGVEIAYDLAVDSYGNVYITGFSKGIGTGDDYATIKYDQNGNELWIARYNGPGNNRDRSIAIALDSLGNVYVTGHSDGIGTNWDYATIKYDPDGNELWAARYNGPGNGSDEPLAITVDESGYIYVTGGSSKAGIDLDYVTIKYDYDGNELWIARYDSSPGDYGDQARDIALDLSGNIYVTGFSEKSKTDLDYVTIKYDPDGNELWVAKYDGFGLSDLALDMVVDALGNVYVTGKSEVNSTDSDFATIKYDTNGNCLWVERYSGPGKLFESARAIAVDLSGNVYVTGGSEGNGSILDATTIAYDSSGNQLWVARYNDLGNGEDYARAIALDSFGNVYVTGRGGSGGYYDIATIAYNSNGDELWVMRYNGPGDYLDDGLAIVVDLSHNVYVTGVSGWDFVTIKYSQEKPILQAIINIDPNTLNLKSKGRWITAYITLNSPYDVNDIDISTVILEDTIPAEWGDVQNETLMVKFDRSEVEDLIGSPAEEVTLTVSGELTDGSQFSGSDTIRVIRPP